MVGCALALPLLTSLVASASAQADLDLRAEARSTTVSATGAPSITAGSTILQPRLAGRLEGETLGAGVSYQPRFWTSDVTGSPSPLFDQTVAAGLHAHREGVWRTAATATGQRGKTDPLADLLAIATTPASGQLASTAPLGYEALNARGEGELTLDPRTTVAVSGTWAFSQGTDAAARALLPQQRMAGGTLSASRLLTERDTLRLAADASRSVIAAPGGDFIGTFGTALAAWRRRLSPTLDGWAGAGGSLTSQGGAGAPPAVSVDPVAQLGVARAPDDRGIALEASARLGPEVDRFTGQIRPTLEGSAGLRWPLARRIALAATVSGGARTDGETVLGSWDGRAVWTLRDRLALELGLLGRWQRDRRPGIPSFVEVGAIVGFTYGLSAGAVPVPQDRAAGAR